MDDDLMSKMIQRMERALLSGIERGGWLQIPFGTVTLGQDVLRDVFSRVDMESVKASVAQRLEHHLADKIFNAMATEIASDVKAALANQKLRSEVRDAVAEKIRQFCEVSHG